MERKTIPVEVGGMEIGPGRPPVLVAGPCVIESREQALAVAELAARAATAAGMPLIFKSSFDKANRTSLDSYRGPGLVEGLKILAAVKERTGLPILTDIHLPEQARAAAEVADVLQIPAFLCRQTDLLLAAAATGRAVNVKKGQFLAPGDMTQPLGKLRAGGCSRILITERGTSFGYNRLVVDMAGLAELLALEAPVIFDGTHSVQLPGGLGKASGGRREMIPPLCRAACAVGVDALFLEVHQDPDRGLCDGPNMLPLADLPPLLERCRRIWEISRSG